LAHRRDAIIDQGFGIFASQLILGRRGHGNVAWHIPDRSVLDIANAGLEFDILRNSSSPDLLDLLYQIQIQASFIRDISARIRARDHFAAELLDLLDRVNRDVARSGNHDPLAFETAGSRGEHPLDEIYGAVAGRLGPGA